MTARLTLISKKTKKPESFPAIDVKMCKALGVESDAKAFYRNWYDRIGMGLALGKTFAEYRDEYNDYLTPEPNFPVAGFEKDLAIANFLDANYIVKN